MNHWRSITGTITEGHGVASGKSSDSRFPQGTIALQKPFFTELGLDLYRYFTGTINVSIAPYKYCIKQSKYTFRAVKWSPTEPAEDFSFFDCRIVLDRATTLEGLIYYPHPETKPEHFHPPDILEILTEFIPDLQYGKEIRLEIDRTQIEIYP
jgi:hypothetical protein